MPKAQLNTSGIKALLSRYDHKHAIAEYVWNGFDAQATRISIDYTVNEIGAVTQIKVTDNGHGINKDRLDSTFTPVLESDKALTPEIQRNTSATHGKSGIGRFTFFKFANSASWNTVYQSNGINLTYNIYIGADTLIEYEASVPVPTDSTPGTTVTFSDLKTIAESSFKSEIRNYLAHEFCWYLELNRRKSFVILINDTPLDYSKYIGDKDSFRIDTSPFSFDIEYIRWNESLSNEFSRYYYIDEFDEEKVKETTRLNNQSDKFFHSVFIRSAYFNDLKRPARDNDNDNTTVDLLGFKRTDKIYKEVMQEISRFLRDKRRPFLASSTPRVLADLRREGAFPHYGNSEWDRIRRYQLEQTVSSIYQYEPKVFSSLNTEQKKIITHLLDLVIDADEKDRLIDIISEIINLSKEERAEFAHILQSSKMSSIIKTIRLIEDRYRTIDQIKQLVFTPELQANERDHVQKVVEQHYWLFGEQYHLVTAAEPKFEEALRRFLHLLRGEDSKQKIDHPDKQKEMDIFMVRRQMYHDKINCVVVELKSPTISLGEKELAQVKKYMSVILGQGEFNASNITWEFYLIGNKFDTSKYIEREIKNAQHHGIPSLAYSVDNYKIFVKTWSEVFAEFDIRHNFLLEQLMIDRTKIHSRATSANGVVAETRSSSAAMPSQITIPPNPTT